MKELTLQLTVIVEDVVPNEAVEQQIGDAINPDGWNWGVSYPSVIREAPARVEHDPADD